MKSYFHEIAPKEAPIEHYHYEVEMGSRAYGVQTDASDVDIYGYGTPPMEYVFPHWFGEIEGFGT